MITCPSCGRENPPGSRFCNACGEEFTGQAPARKERKVVSVLFCDLVGFTADSERRDPEDVEDTLSRYHRQLRRALEAHGGTVEKFIGDAVMAVFGAPVAHEDDPERAVRAALAIRDATADSELQVRIGITTGEALVALGANPQAGEGMASGDVVNTAARLETAAATDAILVDAATFRATERAIRYRQHEPVTAKGKSQPLGVWEALEARARLGVDVTQFGRAPLVGRDADLEALVAAFGRARRRREPELVTIVGVPGIGKSRLVWELFRHVDAEREFVTWRQGRSLPYGEGVSFWALGEIVKAQAGILESDSAETASEKLGRSLAELLADESERGWVEAHLRPLLGLGEERQLQPERQREAFAAWRRFLQAVAEQGPAVLMFEDLHWADDALLDFVDELVEWLSDVPLLVVATARPELQARRPTWAGGKANALTLSLAPLSQDEVIDLVRALVEEPLLAAADQQALVERSAGNPLYAEEFARLAADPRAETSLPETVQGIIAARLDTLTGKEKRVLQNAAVIGKVFWTGGVETLTETPRWTLEELLHALERKEFVRTQRRSSVAGETEYAFRHVLIRDVAYAQLPRAARAEKHEAAAAWLESLGRPEDHAELLAHHYVAALQLSEAAGRATDGLAQRARRSLVEAGDRAAALNAFATAAGYYERALELWPDDDRERPRVLFALAEALHRSGAEQRHERLEEARAALLEARDYERAAEAEAMLAQAAWYEGRHDRADEHLKRALALIRQRRPSPAKARVLNEVARHQMLGGENDDAIEFGREALAAAEAHGLDELRAEALITIGMARANAEDAAGVADVEEGLAIALTCNALAATSRAYNNLAALSGREGDFRRARECFEHAVRAAERLGDRQHLRYARANLVHDQYDVGQWDEALAGADEFIAECERGSAHYQEHLVRRIRAAIRHARGDREGALEDAQQALAHAREANDAQALSPAVAYFVRLNVELGRLEEANALAAEDPNRGLRADFALVAAEIGGLDEVRASLSALRHKSLWDRVVRAIADGQLARAADLATNGGSLALGADIRVRAAQKLLAEGQRAEADEQLQQALDFYRSVGATRNIREGEELLERLRQAPQPRARTAKRLTPRRRH